MSVLQETPRFTPPPSLRERALEIIREAISSGELDEGRIYSAAGLAKELGMSLSPVREAMMSLVSEGTLEAIPNRGFRLTPITDEDFEEIIRIRVHLSQPAVQHLCDLAAAGDRDALTYGGIPLHTALDALDSRAAQAMAAVHAADRSGFYRHDRAFHRALLEHGLGPRAAAISLRLRDQSRLSPQIQRTTTVDYQSGRELGELVELIRSGQKDAAVALVTANLYYFKRDTGDGAVPPPAAAEPASA